MKSEYVERGVDYIYRHCVRTAFQPFAISFILYYLHILLLFLNSPHQLLASYAPHLHTYQVIVGTPGTVKRWVLKGYLKPDSIRIFVLDEADKMVEERSLGADTLGIRQRLNKAVQILFFSATYSKEILAYARTVVPRAYLVTPRSTEELVLDVIFQVRMDVNKCPGGKLQVSVER